jgi:hypothetical protein
MALAKRIEPKCKTQLSVTSDFHRDVDEICALLGHYAASNGNPLPTFRDNVSVPTSRVKKSKNKRSVSSWTSWPLNLGPTRCPETSVKDYHSTLPNIPEERRSLKQRRSEPLNTVININTTCSNITTKVCKFPRTIFMCFVVILRALFFFLWGRFQVLSVR